MLMHCNLHCSAPESNLLLVLSCDCFYIKGERRSRRMRKEGKLKRTENEYGRKEAMR
jgi:hypothetical protein